MPDLVAHAGIRIGVIQINRDTRSARAATATQSQRPTPSSPKAAEVNATPPWASVVAEPLCVPPEKFAAPVTIRLPLPLSSPPVCVNAPVLTHH